VLEKASETPGNTAGGLLGGGLGIGMGLGAGIPIGEQVRDVMRPAPVSKDNADSRDPATLLGKLKELFDQGLISKEEYVQKRNRILNEL